MKDKPRVSNNDIRVAKKILGYKVNSSIVEKKLKIPPDYQYKAIYSRNFLQANWHKNKMIILQMLVKLNKEMSVLDLGTGSGNFEIMFSKKVNKIVGVDYNDEALLFLQRYILKHKIKNVTLVQSDIRDLHNVRNFPKFDLIVLADVIEHLRIEEIENLVKYLKKLLKDNGKVSIITPNYNGPWILIEYLLDQVGLVPKFREEQHLTKIHKSKLLQIFKESGYKLEKFFTFNLFSFMVPLKELSEMLCLAESRIPFPIGNLIAAVFSYSGASKQKKGKP